MQNHSQYLQIKKHISSMLHDQNKGERTNKIELFLHECAGWIRLLDFFKQENSYLKTRLSIAVDHKIDKDFLNEAEHFQNLFILKDEFINEIAHDARVQERKLKEKQLDDKVLKSQQKLRNEIEHLEKDFTKMKNDFNKQLSAII